LSLPDHDQWKPWNEQTLEGLEDLFPLLDD